MPHCLSPRYKYRRCKYKYKHDSHQPPVAATNHDHNLTNFLPSTVHPLPHPTTEGAPHTHTLPSTGVQHAPPQKPTPKRKPTTPNPVSAQRTCPSFSRGDLPIRGDRRQVRLPYVPRLHGSREFANETDLSTVSTQWRDRVLGGKYLELVVISTVL